MEMLISTVAYLDEKLKQANIPIVSVRQSDNEITVEYAPGATVQQIADGEAIVAAFDPAEVEWAKVRSERDILLRQTDWTQLTDAQLSVEEKAAYVTYRQELRDIPQRFTDPARVVFPVRPEAGVVVE